MIHIEYGDRLTVSGHAEYGVHPDPVCEAVTCLVQTLIESVYRLTDDRPAYELNKGHFEMDIKDLQGIARTLADSFYIGAELLSAAYPECVQASRRG